VMEFTGEGLIKIASCRVEKIRQEQDNRSDREFFDYQCKLTHFRSIFLGKASITEGIA